MGSTSLGLAEDIYLVVVNKNQLSSETNPGCFGFIGDEILPSDVGKTFINHVFQWKVFQPAMLVYWECIQIFGYLENTMSHFFSGNWIAGFGGKFDGN